MRALLHCASILTLWGCTPRSDPPQDSRPTTPTTSLTGTVVGTPTGCADESNLQARIDAAPAGARVEVCPGTHQVNLEVVGELVLAGVGRLTALDGGGLAPVVSVADGGRLTLVDLEIRNGLGGDAQGGGVTALDEGLLRIEGCDIHHNEGDAGGVRGPYGGMTEILYTRIHHNIGVATGGLALGLGALTQVEIDHNMAGETGGGVWVYSLGGVDADADVRVHGNTAPIGGGVAIDWASYWRGGTIEENVADYGGGLAAASVSTQVESTLIRDNQALIGGGGFYSGHGFEGPIILRDLEVRENRAPDGGGLFLFGAGLGASALSLENVRVAANDADRGGGLFLQRMASSVVGGEVLGNTAVEGGGLYVPSGSIDALKVNLGEGADDNQPGDLRYIGQDYDFDGAVSFVCNALCG